MSMWFVRFITYFTVLVCSVQAQSQNSANDSHVGNDLLSLVHGAVTVSQSSELGDKWKSVLLLDGSTQYGWASSKNTSFPHSVVIELAHISSLRSFVINNVGSEDSSSSGASARHVEIWTSVEGPDQGFTQITAVEALQSQRQQFDFKQAVKSRWLKLVVTSNYGHPSYTRIMEVEAYGTVVEHSKPPALAGVYQTNYNLMMFGNIEDQVHGCYDYKNGTLTGKTDGRTVQFEWRETTGIGTAVMVFAADGQSVSGVWYRSNGSYGNYWEGSRADSKKPQCKVKVENAISRALKEKGRSTTYGLLFDVGRDTFKEESELTLNQVFEALGTQDKLNLIIEGHTDSTGNEDFNRKLSQGRADAVVQWLVDKGIAASRLTAEGHGADKPVADNSTAKGRALNRRVELRKRP